MIWLIMALGCAEDVAKDKVAATVEEAPAAPAVKEEVPADLKVIPVDPARSSVSARGAKVTKTHDIVFPSLTGELQMSGSALVGVSVVVSLDALTTDSEKLAKHLKSDDFFDVSTFPEAKFTGKVGGDGNVTGEFSLRGKTKQLTFPAQMTIDDTTVQADAEFTINRQDFGVVYPGKPDDLIQDNVVIKVKLVGAR